MVKQKKFQEFLDKHRKTVILYNLFIWGVLLILILVYNAETPNLVSREDMALEIEKRCSNEIIIPEMAYNVIFTYNSVLNTTFCEVVTE